MRDYTLIPSDVLERYISHADSEVRLWTRNIEQNVDKCETSKKMRDYWAESLEELQLEKSFRES